MKKIASIVLTIIFIFAIYANSVAVKAAQNVIDNTTEGKIVEIKENETKNLEDYQGDNIPIILICADRRTKSEQMLIKLFGISVYDALLGPDRNIDELCKLINKPRSKKEAKIYYKIDSEDVNYKPENENDVSEVEIQNILAHYKRLGKNEEKYLESFDNIASQYNDVQLRIICKFLPLNVRAVLEEKSPKYQKVMSFNSKVTDRLRKGKHNEEANGTSEKLLKTVNTKETLLSKPVVIPNAVNLQNTKKLTKPKPVEENKEEEDPLKQIEREINTYVKNENGFVQTQQTKTTKQEENLKKAETEEKTEEVESKPAPKRGRGRPRKNPLPEEDAPKKKRGRPKKNTEDENQLQIQDEEDLIMPGIEETTKQEENIVMPGLEEEQEENIIMPGLEEKAEELGMKETIEPKENEIRPINTIGQISKTEQTINTEIDISSLLTGNKKLACFVGTSKNGTSFIVNNVAQILSTHGISTAILDLTQNRNSYYVYTNNIEDLRNTAIYCFQNLINGNPKGIQANKNLTVYTSLPDDNEIIENAGEILQTLVKNYSVVLIDCDFKTPLSYFSYAQEIYLVQSMDVLTIQPLTSFLNELRSKNILDEKKLRIILNKVEKLKKASEKVIIGGMSSYNDPAMTYMVELFDKNLIKYISIPFDEQVYVKYLDGLIDCEISLKGYPKNIIQILTELANMIYKNTAGTTSYRPPTVNGNGFSPSINSTLEQMRKY